MNYLLKSKEAKLRDGVDQDPVVLLVDDIIYTAITLRASDIHLEPGQHRLRVRYRIDGVLYDQEPVALEKALSLLSRLKVISSLDIAQRRMPQDGKLRLAFIDNTNSSRTIDLRISTFPTIYGEKIVVRILDKYYQSISLESLGCSNYVLQEILRLIEQPHGFFLVTGPTGSGKTTTLYAMLSKLHDPERNIVTMEDPVEYHIDGITQTQINEKINFTFERGLRSLLRQDPDVAMVGEIRDKKTAQVAIQAALTGHLVLSTLHTNDSVGAITRLLDMNIEPFLINASVSAVLAQRLVCVLCSVCKEEAALSDQEKEIMKQYGFILDKTWQAKGCEKCSYLGHQGRTGVFELFVLDDEVRMLVKKQANAYKVRKQAVKDGMKLLKDDAFLKVKEGIISFKEFLRILC